MGNIQSIPSSAISSLTISLVLKKKLVRVSPLCFRSWVGKGCCKLAQPFCDPRNTCGASEVFCERSSSWHASCMPRLCICITWLSVLPLPCSQWMCHSSCPFLQAFQKFQNFTAELGSGICLALEMLALVFPCCIDPVARGLCLERKSQKCFLYGVRWSLIC